MISEGALGTEKHWGKVWVTNHYLNAMRPVPDTSQMAETLRLDRPGL